MSIKNLRIQKGLSQEELAQLCNLSSRTIQRIEKDNKASYESLNEFSRVFNISIEELENIMNEKSNENKSNIKEDQKEYDNFFFYLKNNPKTIRFIIINVFLIIINISTNIENLWFPYVLIGWGFFHFYKRFMEYKNFK